MKRCQCGNLLRAPGEQEQSLCLECRMAGKKRILTPGDVLRAFDSASWIKVAPTRIRAITAEDVQSMGDSFLDLEGRRQRVAVGRYLCVGVQGERWTCSQIRDRVLVSGPDSEGFRLYVQLDPKPVACFRLAFPFVLQSGEKDWESQPDGGIITWNGCTGPDLDMRVIERSIFRASYTLYSDQVKLLSVPVPFQLEECCGYTGEARFVAFFWGIGDESYYADGRVSGTGEWDGYQLFVNHWRVQPALRGFDLGSSEDPAMHWLILDRHTRRLSVAKAAVAEQLLRQQWKMPDQEEPILVVSKEEWDRLVQELSIRIHVISQQETLAFMTAHQNQVNEMRAWLDRVGDPVAIS